MNQQINLYKKEKKSLASYYTFQYMLWVLCVFFGFLVLMASYDVVQHVLINKKFDALTKEQTEKNKKLQNISGQVPEAKTREQLLSEIKKYEEEQKTQKEVLEVLSGQSNKINGFSGYLESLSKQAISGLWFTQLSFKDNGGYMLLEGETLKPEYVPQLIEQLSHEAIFRGQTFQVFKVDLDAKTQRIDFVLESKIAKKHE